MKQPFLKKDNFIYLRALSENDISDNYLNWLNDKEITQYLETGHFPVIAGKVREYIKECSDGNNLLLAIVLVKNNKHVGNIRLGPINWIHRKADIGIMIGNRSCWGKGIAEAALQVVLKHAFENLGLKKVTLDVTKLNARAVRLYERLGFRKEGVLRKHAFLNGSFYDVLLYGLLAEDFKYGR